jgi:hypothetical protein
MIVVDVSVLFGLVVKRDDYHSFAIAARKRDPDWQAPRLFRSEFRSIAAGHLRRGEPLQNVLAAAANAQLAVTIHRSSCRAASYRGPTPADPSSALGAWH